MLSTMDSSNACEMGASDESGQNPSSPTVNPENVFSITNPTRISVESVLERRGVKEFSQHPSPFLQNFMVQPAYIHDAYMTFLLS